MSAEVLTFKPRCEVCGHPMDKEFLKNWNDHQVCMICISECTAEEAGGEVLGWREKRRK